MAVQSTKMPLAIAARTGIPIAVTRQVCRRLREGALLPSGRLSPKPRTRDVGRIVLGLASDRMASVPEVTRALEALPLASDHGAPPTAGIAIEMLCRGLIGMDGFSRFDLREGFIDIAPDEGRLTISCRDAMGRPVAIRYGAAARVSGQASRVLSVPFSVIRAMCGALL